jgi:hypothetical protein
MVNCCTFTSLYPVFDYEGLDTAWVNTELNSILYLGVGVMILSPALINFFSNQRPISGMQLQRK